MKKLSGVFICLLLFTFISSARIIEVADAGITDKLKAVIAAKNAGGAPAAPAADHCADGCTSEPDADLLCEDSSDDAGDGKLCTWTDTAGSGTINWKATHNGTLGCTDKGTYALQLDMQSSDATYVKHDLGSEVGTVHGKFWFNIVSESMSNTEEIKIFKTQNANPSSSFALRVTDDNGTLKFTSYVYDSGFLIDIASSHTISTGTWYRVRFDVVYNTSTEVWIADWDGSNEEKVSDRTPSAGRDIRYMMWGDDSASSASAVIQIDNTKFDDDTAISADCTQ